MAEYMLSEKHGLIKPRWINHEDYDAVINAVVFTEDQRTGAGGPGGR